MDERQKKLEQLKKWYIEKEKPDASREQSRADRLKAMIEDKEKGTAGLSLKDPLWK